MKEAIIFETVNIISANDALGSIYEKVEFTSKDGTDKVYIVRKGKGNSGPYFRRYKSLKEQRESCTPKDPLDYKR